MELAPGDRLPFCVGVGVDRSFYSLDAQAGRPAVLLLGGSAAPAAFNPLLAALAERQPEFAASNADLLLCLGFAALPRLYLNPPSPGLRTILCPDEFFTSCAASSGEPVLVVVDRGARILACWRSGLGEPERIVSGALDAVRRLPHEPGRDCSLPAPVLAIPGLLDTAFCRELIERFEVSATFDSAVSGSGRDGAPQDRLDHGRKCRRDWMLEPGDGVHERVLACLFRRCVPDISRAFQHDVSHVDRILVARYDETIGHFKRHRDNTGPAVAFRQFALSVNLNAGEYEGGYLLFPEFNDHRYRPATGEGLVFSASLLHEATEVTSGRRYVLLSFLHDNKAARGTPAQREPALALNTIGSG